MKRISFFDVMTTVFIVFIACIIGFIIYYYAGPTEVEIYSVGCEVSQMAYAEEQVSRSSSRPVYKMGVRNDEFATVLEITANQFAQFTVGDIVEVKVTVKEGAFGELYNIYELLGPLTK